MVKVITYGTYDLLHYGHIRLLERAKALGDYLIVGVTADDFDKSRGKINVQQPLMERVEAVRATGLADEIIIEEYEGQKIDDIRRMDVDIFAVGSDWIGYFDYLKEYCQVVYLERTEGISSSEIRGRKRSIQLGMVGDSLFLNKIRNEASFVNGLKIAGVYTKKPDLMDVEIEKVNAYEKLLDQSDAVYIRSQPSEHYMQIKEALDKGKHVLCESPVTLSKIQTEELFQIAEEKNLVLMEAMKTAYSTAFSRLVLLTKTGKIGHVVSVDATCTSLKDEHVDQTDWNGFYEWGPTGLLPVFDILGTDYRTYVMTSHFGDKAQTVDKFTKIDLTFEHAVASVKVGDGVKSEGELIISGTKGYIYVPAPWWNTEYFELRYENPSNNKRYFYQLDGEGIRYELAAFARAVERGNPLSNIDGNVTETISDIMDAFVNKKNMIIIS